MLPGYQQASPGAATHSSRPASTFCSSPSSSSCPLAFLLPMPEMSRE